MTSQAPDLRGLGAGIFPCLRCMARPRFRRASHTCRAKQSEEWVLLVGGCRCPDIIMPLGPLHASEAVDAVETWNQAVLAVNRAACSHLDAEQKRTLMNRADWPQTTKVMNDDRA